MKDYLQVNKEAYNQLANQYTERTKRYVESDKLVLQPFIKEIKHLDPNPKILELGPGSGLALQMFTREGFNTTAIDIAEEIIKNACIASPDTIFIHDEFLTHDFGIQTFDGVFAKAFIHLFATPDATEVIKKIHALLKENGVAFISTTVHDKSEEGYREKTDYKNSPKRYRKKWTEEELLETFSKSWTILHKNYHQVDDKSWLALVLRKN